jgi:pimeloyl-ACP methyl ester carboxylesterase
MSDRHEASGAPGPAPTGAEGCLDREPLGTCLLFPRSCGPEGATFVAGDDAGVRLASYRFEGHPGAGWLLHFHGNGELAADYADDPGGHLFGLGVNLCFAEYRGYGPSTGTPTLRALLGDAEAQLRGLGVPPGRVVVYGRSLGSLAAIELAARHPDLAGVIVESGIADVAERLLLRVEQAEVPFPLDAVPAEVARYFDHRAKLGRYLGPLLVIHAERDDLVPARHARSLHAWGGGAERALVLLPRGDHNSLLWLNRDAYREAVGGFLDRLGLTGP